MQGNLQRWLYHGKLQQLQGVWEPDSVLATYMVNVPTTYAGH